MKQKFFEIVPHGTKYDFLASSRFTLALSAIMIIASLVLLFAKGLNYGVDFKGGTQVHVRFNKATDAKQIRESLGPIGLGEAVVQDYGDGKSSEFLIRILPEKLNLTVFREEFLRKLGTVAPEGSNVNLRISEERMYASFASPVASDAVKASLAGLSEKTLTIDSVSPFGNSDNNEHLILFSGAANRLTNGFASTFGEKSFEVLQIDQVGAKVGKDLRAQAVGAVLISILLILVYIWFRFDLEFAPGAIAALVHDSLLVLGIFALFRLQFDLSIVAAVLTIVGFSINDTIVIYDRIRENVKEIRHIKFYDLINKSVNETLSRTVLTSGTLLLAALALWFWGGPITRNFAIAFTVGVIAGTYSTIFIASPLTMELHKAMQRKKVTSRKK